MKSIELFGKPLSNNLRNASKIYLNNAIRLYLKIKGRVSIYDSENLGDSANIICSLNRCIEHLLKLKLELTDPLLLYPFPKKIEDYLKIKNLDVKSGINKANITLISNTITFKEAVDRVKLLAPKQVFEFEVFKEINSLRNSIEHCWDRNEKFLQKSVGIMSSKIIPAIKSFITKVLGEDFSLYCEIGLLKEVERLDRAMKEGHSLKAQERLETHIKLYEEKNEKIDKLDFHPPEYANLDEIETEVECPVCKKDMIALWDYEVDYDESGPVFASPDAKCLYCKLCRFFVDGEDIETYLPDGLDLLFEEAYNDDY